MIDGLKEIYNDFYGPASEKPQIDVPNRTPVRSPVKVEPVRKEPAGDESQEIEVEVTTQEVAAVKKKVTATSSAEDPEKPKEPEKSGMEELSELIGLESVKHDVEELVGLAKVRKMREEKGMKAVPVSLHLVFSGNPGTGKTTVARILAKLYKEIGILSTGQLVETDRSGLVAGYVGQTAIKTRAKIDEAMGGVLFIDEAYTLNQEGENYGQEAIDTILKAMEDQRDQFVVIVAGYTDLMKEFIESNPGLRSRFNKFFEFPDYTADELKQIFDLQCTKYQYKLTEEAEKAAHDEIVKMEANKGENFANARAVRNLFEKIITNQAARVSALENVDEETLTTITIEDLQDIEEPMTEEREKQAEELIDLLETYLKDQQDAAGQSGEKPVKEEKAAAEKEPKKKTKAKSKKEKAGPEKEEYPE